MAGKLGASEGMSGPGGEHLFGARHPLVFIEFKSSKRCLFSYCPMYWQWTYTPV
jgi:hypothetical protein